MNATNYLNSKHRRIFQGKTGGFYAQSDDGNKVYAPKAMYYKVGGEGAVRRISSHNLVPNKIRSTKFRMKTPGTNTSPVFNLPSPHLRRVRKNKGVKRANMSPMFNLPSPHLRRVRKNKGVKRVAVKPRIRKVSLRVFKRSNPYAALMRNI